jgi:hypothetical protein
MVSSSWYIGALIYHRGSGKVLKQKRPSLQEGKALNWFGGLSSIADGIIDFRNGRNGIPWFLLSLILHCDRLVFNGSFIPRLWG